MRLPLRNALPLAALLLAAPASPAAEPPRPNFVVINIDDLGYADVGPFGSKLNRTPHLDRLATEGRKLTCFYAAPVCSPSRAALMTGCYPKRVLPIGGVLFPGNDVGLSPDEVTVAEVLRDAGYATAIVGKWHLGDQPDFLPNRQGFDLHFGLPYSNDMGPAEDGVKSDLGQPLPKPKGPGQPPLPLLRNGTVVKRVRPDDQQSLVEIYTQEAETFVAANAGRPFFLYLAHNAVHFPLYPGKGWAGKSPHGLFSDWVEETDWSVGRVLDALRTRGLAEKTLVLFTSDNGGTPRSVNAPHPGLTRRGFLRVGSLGLGGLTLPAVLRAREARPAARTDTAVILYWMGGGPSHIDTWDPKPDAPAEVRGPFGSAATRTPGLRFCELLPEQAKVAHEFAVLRSVTHTEAVHGDAAHLVQTGYHERNVQFRGQIHPAQGSVVAKLRGPNAPGLPPYVCIPDAYFARQGFFQSAAYLGKEYDPVSSGGEPTVRFTTPGPSFALPAGVTVTRAEDRRELLRRIDAAAARHAPTAAGMDAAYRRAFDLVTSRAAKEAFDRSREAEKTRERYGANPRGRGALLARRLVEAGVTFVTVSHYEADVDWWDDHAAIEKNLRKRLPPFDRALAALVGDLHDRGLADRVLVVAMGEFGRAPRVDAQAGRGHWPRAMSVLLSGCGVRGGRVVGATTRDGGEPATHPYTPGDLLATIYHALGLDPAGTLPDREGRPVRVVESGAPIRELL